MTAYISVEDAVALTKAGAADYLTKPFDLDVFVAKTRRAVERARDRYAAPLVAPDGSLARPGSGMLGRSAEMRRIEEISARIRDIDSAVLLTGESGVGKEVVARFIHRNSTRADGPFVAVNCAALPSELVSSELFGIQKGAFAGAEENRAGKFELAQGGTIFLDEIAEIPDVTQIKLLRVLQDHQVERLGGTGPTELDVRVMAASQADLEAEVAKGNFRSDLFWRLNVLRIEVPPLRERRDDILFLARNFVSAQAARMERPVEGLSAAAEERLMRMDFPGNVRQLRNMIERAVALGAGPRIQVYDLSADEFPSSRPGPEAAGSMTLKENVQTAERAAIVRALGETGGVLHLAAEHLGVSRKTLWEKMRRYHIARD
jgi:DNA-binding NtrC family response regulator